MRTAEDHCYTLRDISTTIKYGKDQLLKNCKLFVYESERRDFLFILWTLLVNPSNQQFNSVIWKKEKTLHKLKAKQYCVAGNLNILRIYYYHMCINKRTFFLVIVKKYFTVYIYMSQNSLAPKVLIWGGHESEHLHIN